MSTHLEQTRLVKKRIYYGAKIFRLIKNREWLDYFDSRERETTAFVAP